MHARFRSSIAPLLPALLFTAMLVFSALPGGCQWLAAGSSARPVTAAEYRGLDNKSVAIVIYAAQANTDEFPGARQEISEFIANQMRLHLPTTRLLNYKEVINWQDETRNWFGLSEKDVGRHFSVDRVVFIELITYEARADKSYGDMQGHMRANCKVFEVDAAGNTPAWTGLIDTTWPKDRPVSANQTNEINVRNRTLQIFSDDLVGHFYDQEKADIPLHNR